MIFVNYKEQYLLYGYIDKYIIYKLYYWKMFDLVILVVINVVSEVLFNSLVESFYLFISLGMKGCRKFVVYF